MLPAALYSSIMEGVAAFFIFYHSVLGPFLSTVRTDSLKRSMAWMISLSPGDYSQCRISTLYWLPSYSSSFKLDE